jgi:hypothetical protein
MKKQMYLLSQGMATVRSTFSLSLEFRSASEENLPTDIMQGVKSQFLPRVRE